MAVRGQVRERDLRVVSFAIGLSALGDFVALVALGLAAKNLAGDGMGSGVAVAALFICLWAPLVVFAGHVGLLVDRVETRSLLVVVSLGQAAVARRARVRRLARAAPRARGRRSAPVSRSHRRPSSRSCPPSPGARTLQATNSTVETARTIGFTIGPVCGSLLVAAGGTSTAMLLDGASFLVVAGAALSLEVRRTAAGQHEEEKRRARDGIGFLFGDRLVALMVVVVFVSLLFMSASIPADLVYTEDVLGVENIGIGVVLSAWTLGMLVGSNVIARRVALGGLATAALVGVVVQGLGKFLAPFWLVFGFMIAAYFVGGIGHGLKNVTSRTLIHARIAPERHGRAFAAWNGVRNAAELGALAVGGVVVGSIGARSTLWLAGGLSALAGVVGLALLAAWRGRVAERPSRRLYNRLPVSSDTVSLLARNAVHLLPEKRPRGEAEARPAAAREARHRRHLARHPHRPRDSAAADARVPGRRSHRRPDRRRLHDADRRPVRTVGRAARPRPRARSTATPRRYVDQAMLVLDPDRTELRYNGEWLGGPRLRRRPSPDADDDGLADPRARRLRESHSRRASRSPSPSSCTR